MLKRLFETDDSTAEPRFDISTNNIANGSGSGTVANFLNRDDRDMLAKAYEVAGENGVDPHEVDNLAFDLGYYRMNAATGNSPDMTGKIILPDGRPAIAQFTSQQEAGARALLSSTAMTDTKIDHDFLHYVTDPGRNPKPAVDFSALRKLAVALSPQHSDGASDPNVSFADRDARTALAEAVAASAPLATSKSSGAPNSVDGKSLMMSRLFGSVGVNAEAGRGSGAAATPGLAAFLTDDDKDMLGNMYALAKANGADLGQLDKLSKSLGALREAEALMKQQGSAGSLRALLLAPKEQTAKVSALGSYPQRLGPSPAKRSS